MALSEINYYYKLVLEDYPKLLIQLQFVYLLLNNNYHNGK